MAVGVEPASRGWALVRFIVTNNKFLNKLEHLNYKI